MKIPTITGIIDRRILINFTVDATVAKAMVPAPFTPKIIHGKAIAGICLIRLKQVRLKGLPAFIGVSSENGAHRIAVEWMENGQLKEGVYIPRRDTSSLFNVFTGGRIFPGKHHHANFQVYEEDNHYNIAFKSSDGTQISVNATLANTISKTSIFNDLPVASSFFQAGSLGYSPNGDKYDGLILNTHQWELKPLNVTQVQSSYFENEQMFPKGSLNFDNALLMKNIAHDWHSAPDKFAPILT